MISSPDDGFSFIFLIWMETRLEGPKILRGKFFFTSSTLFTHIFFQSHTHKQLLESLHLQMQINQHVESASSKPKLKKKIHQSLTTTVLSTYRQLPRSIHIAHRLHPQPIIIIIIINHQTGTDVNGTYRVV